MLCAAHLGEAACCSIIPVFWGSRVSPALRALPEELWLCCCPAQGKGSWDLLCTMRGSQGAGRGTEPAGTLGLPPPLW